MRAELLLIGALSIVAFLLGDAATNAIAFSGALGLTLSETAITLFREARSSPSSL